MTLKEFLLKKNVFDQFKANVYRIVPEKEQNNVFAATEQVGHVLSNCFPFINTNEGYSFWQNLNLEYNEIRYNVTNNKYLEIIDRAAHYSLYAEQSVDKLKIQNKILSEFLNTNIENIKNDANYQNTSFIDLVEIVSLFTRDHVKEDGNRLDDENSVAWHMGVLCYMYIKSLPICNDNFHNLFMNSWRSYFNKLS